MKTTIQLAIFSFMFIGMNACVSPDSQQKAQDQQATEMATQIATSCHPDSIPVGEAETMIAEAKTYIENLNSYLENGENKPSPYYDIPRGSKLPQCEMSEIMEQLGADAEIWAMMALEINKAGNKELTIIFQCKAKGSESYVYYDFTQPCPAQCPE